MSTINSIIRSASDYMREIRTGLTRGRVGRLGYWLAWIPYICLAYVAPFEAQALIQLVFGGAVLIIAVKRSHDLGHSGWLILVPFYLVYMLFASGETHANKYGPASA